MKFEASSEDDTVMINLCLSNYEAIGINYMQVQGSFASANASRLQNYMLYLILLQSV